ncbi:hypothetical protein [Acanthopleuribacter pedis]|uniref:DUF4403 family protein n=1 Tax=Acanthopleuribacter pedis TaxID=442870 RepID=A0A8J7QIF1_9BACT|nr:hypothetical protein [Acanthopleuribacter pedis]MBO1318863.1 hypothetical protein [Acanthopleuribacter pedis]
MVRVRKRVLLVLLFFGLLLLGVGVAGAIHRSMVTTRWAEHQALVEALHAEAKSVPEFSFRDSDNIRFGLGQEALRPLFQAVEGLEISAAGGHKVTMHRLETRFDRGVMRVNAEAEFESPFLFYRSPLAIKYLAFSDVDENGRCVMSFVIERLEIENLPVLARRWFEAWLSVTLQHRMPLPELMLPLHFKTELPFSGMERLVKKRNLTVAVPARTLDLQAEMPRLVVANYCLRGASLLFPGSVEPTVPPAFAQPDCARPDTLGVALSLSLLNQTIAAVVEPQVDVTLHAARMTNVINREKKVLGIKTRNQLDIKDFQANLDVHEAALEFSDGRLWLFLNVSGQASGTLVGKMYGIPLNNRVEAEPKLTQRVPIRLEERDGLLEIAFEQETLQLEGHATVEVLNQKIRVALPLEIKPRFLSRAFPVDQWVEKTYKVPRRIKGKKVVEEQHYRLLFNWQLDPDALSRQWIWLQADQIQLEPIAPETAEPIAR